MNPNSLILPTNLQSQEGDTYVVISDSSAERPISKLRYGTAWREMAIIVILL